MTEIKRESKTEQGSPASAFRQDHEGMRAASMTPLTGPAATDALAASGGLDVPGGDAARVKPPVTSSAARESIPGERDASTLTHREPGGMSAPFNGDTSVTQPSTLTQETIHDREIEGAGEDVPRLNKEHHKHNRP